MKIWTTTLKTLTWISFTKVSLLLLTQITYLQKDFKSKFKDYTENSFSVLHLNIRSLSKNLESMKNLYNLLSFKFSIVCFSETWSKDEKIDENSLYQLESLNLLHQNRKHKNDGGVAISVKDSCSFKNRDDLSINSEVNESLSIEITHNESKNIIFNTIVSRKTFSWHMRNSHVYIFIGMLHCLNNYAKIYLFEWPNLRYCL